MYMNLTNISMEYDNSFSIDQSSVAYLVLGERKKRKRWIVGAIAVACVLVAATVIGLGVGLGLKPGAADDPKPLMSTSNQYSYHLEGEVRIDDSAWGYTSQLSHKSSNEFNNFEHRFCSEASSSSFFTAVEEMNCKINTIRRGSVVINFDIEVIENKTLNATEDEIKMTQVDQQYQAAVHIVSLFMDNIGEIQNVLPESVSINDISIVALYGIAKINSSHYGIQNQETFEKTFCDKILDNMSAQPHTNLSCSVQAIVIHSQEAQVKFILLQISKSKTDFTHLRRVVTTAISNQFTMEPALIVDGANKFCDALMCDKICNQTGKIPMCSCPTGYEMDRYHQCQDINECAVNNGGCGSVTCTNTIGSHKCIACHGFHCDNSLCVNYNMKCDGKDDCGDLSDEQSCSCGRHETACNVGPCIKDELWCNGVRDCMDGSDEARDCGAGCPSSTFTCYTDFETFKCLNRSQVCDGKADCIGATDEKTCGLDCGYSYLPKCHWGMCLKKSESICDGRNDCIDWSDELNCGVCPEYTVRCNAESVLGNPNDFYCVDDDYLCDTVLDCPLGEDETPEACDLKKRVPIDCEAVQIDASKSGFITSPNYPHYYNNNADCSWILTAEEGHAIRFTINSFNLQDPGIDYLSYTRTCKDQVAAYDSSNVQTPMWFGCGVKHGSFESTGNVVIVVFVSDESITNKGFKINYSQFKSQCRGGFSAVFPGSLTTPHYPSPYGPNHECFWSVTAELGYRVKLTFTDFQLPNKGWSDKCSDVVLVYDGVLNDLDTIEEHTVFKDCGRHVGTTFTSTSYTFIIYFVSGADSTQAKGFSISYEQVWHGCADNLEYICEDNPHQCVDLTMKCDGIADCDDKSDEWDCECDVHQFLCASERICMSNDWLCDGDIDCRDGQDEHNCETCTTDQFQCSNKHCISLSQLCDGVNNCIDGADEVACMHLKPHPVDVNNEDSGILVVGREHINSTLSAICSTNWNDQWANLACRLQGFKGLSTSTEIPLTDVLDMNFASFMTVSAQLANTSILSGAQFSNTPCNAIIQLECDAFVCGSPVRGPEDTRRRQRRVINGDLAIRESWPWMVSIHHAINNGDHICGGSILNEHWILTAAHCISGHPIDFSIYIGDVDKDKGDRYLAERTVVHPNYTTNARDMEVTNYAQLYNDVALIKLSTPIQFRDNRTMRICLPHAARLDTDYTRCYVTGWGQTLPKKGDIASSPQYMRQGKLNLMPIAECQGYYTDHWNTFPFNLTYEVPVYDDKHVCAEQMHGLVDSCYGDSGGPLNCEDVHGNWFVLGIVSHGDALSCTSFTIYERVSGHFDWIHSVMEIS